MAEKILMTALSPTMQAGRIVAWNKQEGDSLTNGDILCEVETDKAVMEYETIQEGVLLKITAEEGASVEVGAIIGIVGEAGEDIQTLLTEVTDAKTTAPPSSDSDASGQSAAAPPSFKPSHNPVKSGDPSPRSASERIKASPLARRLAGRAQLDLSKIAGTGPGGRIVKKDILTATNANSGTELSIPLSAKRKIIAERLAESMFTAPHYYLKTDIDMSALTAMRERFNKAQLRRDPEAKKLSLNAVFMKLTAAVLTRHPVVNSSWENEAIIRFDRTAIGLAVAQEDGLITPVVSSPESKGIAAIDTELRALIEKARNGTLTPTEYSGATFTISNLGSFGVDEFTAIINPPASAILAIGAIRRTPAAGEDDTVVIKPMMRITLSCDHRVIDGAVGAVFLRDLKQAFEHPETALF